ncbi:MAG: hypothetical protein OEW29_05600 [Acidimicrobiia bacterium]|nr:hypothetical protein [Acidimicrobiia bacterium]
MTDALTARYDDLLTGSYDCVDRIVLNAYFNLGHSPGGFRVWWRRWQGDDTSLDDTHLIRLAGRFARRVRGWAKANGVPVIDTKAGERKHLIAQDYLRDHDGRVPPGVFMVLVARAPATVWKVERANAGHIVNLAKTSQYVNHYSFHIWDPVWGHVTIKMSGHAPFGAQIILNGHHFVAAAADRAGVVYQKEGNCFTVLPDPAHLAQIADTVSQPETAGRLREVCDRWIYTACLCFGLDVADQEASGFVYDYSIYQVEYSRNLLFANGARMQRVFEAIVDRTRSRLDVKTVKTLFGAKTRPHWRRKGGPPRLEAMIETPTYDLTNFKVHFGRLTLKAYSKGEHVLRVEAITHNTRDLGCGRVLDRWAEITNRLAGMADRFCTALDCVDVAFVPDGILDQLPEPSQLGASRVGGIDLNKTRIRHALGAVLALAVSPDGFTVTDYSDKVRALTGQTDQDYTLRQGAYDLRKLRAKGLVDKPGRTRRYHVPHDAARTIAGILALRDHVIAPILAGIRSPQRGRRPATWTAIDRDYEQLRIDMQTLLADLAINTPAAA